MYCIFKTWLLRYEVTFPASCNTWIAESPSVFRGIVTWRWINFQYRSGADSFLHHPSSNVRLVGPHPSDWQWYSDHPWPLVTNQIYSSSVALNLKSWLEIWICLLIAICYPLITTDYLCQERQETNTMRSAVDVEKSINFFESRSQACAWWLWFHWSGGGWQQTSRLVYYMNLYCSILYHFVPWIHINMINMQCNAMYTVFKTMLWISEMYTNTIRRMLWNGWCVEFHLFSVLRFRDGMQLSELQDASASEALEPKTKREPWRATIIFGQANVLCWIRGGHWTFSHIFFK